MRFIRFCCSDLNIFCTAAYVYLPAKIVKKNSSLPAVAGGLLLLFVCVGETNTFARVEASYQLAILQRQESYYPACLTCLS